MPEDTKEPNFGPVKVGGAVAPPTAKRGRGRPPGTPNKNKNPTDPVTTAELDQAMQVLESMYDFLGMGLVMGQLPATATHLSEQRATLAMQNEKALRAAPKLCRSIARVGATSGTGAFLGAQALLVFGLWNVASREMEMKRVAREAADSPRPDTQARYE